MDENNNTTVSAGEGTGASQGGENKSVVTKLIIILIVILALGSIYVFVRKSSQKGEVGEGANVAPPVSSPVPAPGVNPDDVVEKIVSPEGTPTSTPEEEAAAKTVFATANGFEPNELAVKKGETVTFVNTTANPVWPASAMHPSHQVYPGSDIKKCGTAQAATIFDACKGLAEGESWSFTFNETGSWNYHDHLTPTKFGKIIVTE